MGHDRLEEYLSKKGAKIRQEKPKSVIVCGDFNAKSSRWGANAEVSRGSILNEWIKEMGLKVVNTGDDPTVERRIQTSHIHISTWSEKGDH